jgi:hypothetical protein
MPWTSVWWFPRRRAGILLATLVLLLAIIGCGGGSSATPTQPPIAGKTTTQLRIGDAAVDRVISFEVTIASPMTFAISGGGTAQVTLGSNRLEISHMSAKSEPLAVLSAPQGTYTGATLTISNPEIVFLDNASVAHTLEGSASQTVTLTFSPALTIGSSPAVVSIDLNVANSIATDASGNITGFNFSASSFTFSTKAVAVADQQDNDGELEDVTGLVTNVSGNNFTMNVGQSGAQLTFATDTNTQFSDGLTNVSSTLNQIVKVEGTTQADNTLLASEVEGLENQNGAELEGLVTAVSGNPAASLTVVGQDGVGSGMDSTKVGASFTANVGGASYKVDLGNIDTSGLGGIPGTPNFPFSGTTVKAGQRAEVESAGAVPAAAGTIVADKVKLQQQAMTGTVSNFVAGSGGAATFDLTLPASSYVALLSGQTTVHVFQQPKTDNRFGTVSNGSVVRVRGLLFWTGSSFNLIARRITQ